MSVRFVAIETNIVSNVRPVSAHMFIDEHIYFTRATIINVEEKLKFLDDRWFIMELKIKFKYFFFLSVLSINAATNLLLFLRFIQYRFIVKYNNFLIQLLSQINIIFNKYIRLSLKRARNRIWILRFEKNEFYNVW